MKSQKGFKKKVPWWAFDFTNEDKGWWKVFFRRKERVRMKRQTQKDYNDV